MNRNTLIKYRWLPALAFFFCLPVLATTVYRSVDENGVVSYTSDYPEGDVTVEEVEIKIAPPPQADVMRQRMQAMRETSEQLAADRIAREKYRAEQRALRAPVQPPYPPPPEPYYPPRYHPGVYPPYYSNSPMYPGIYGYPPRPRSPGYGHWPPYPNTWPHTYPPAYGHPPVAPQRPRSAITPKR